MTKPLLPEDHDWISANGGEEIEWAVRLGYEHFSRRAILKALLPMDAEEVPAHFEVVGHIAHYNLKEEHLPFKHIIGEWAYVLSYTGGWVATFTKPWQPPVATAHLGC
jgi:tRNA (guanine37-N1)-methyltransferase